MSEIFLFCLRTILLILSNTSPIWQLFCLVFESRFIAVYEAYASITQGRHIPVNLQLINTDGDEEYCVRVTAQNLLFDMLLLLKIFFLKIKRLLSTIFQHYLASHSHHVIYFQQQRFKLITKGHLVRKRTEQRVLYSAAVWSFNMRPWCGNLILFWLGMWWLEEEAPHWDRHGDTAKHVRNSNQDHLTFGSSSIHHALPGSATPPRHAHGLPSSRIPSSPAPLSSAARWIRRLLNHIQYSMIRFDAEDLCHWLWFLNN